MIKKLTLVAGLGAGYLLGAKAGKERYRQIMQQVNGFLGRPEVQDAKDNLTNAATEKASAVADTAKAKVEDLTSGSDSPGKDSAGKDSSGSGSSGAPTLGETPLGARPPGGMPLGANPSAPTGPIPGAAPSDTV